MVLEHNVTLSNETVVMLGITLGMIGVLVLMVHYVGSGFRLPMLRPLLQRTSGLFTVLRIISTS